MKPSTVLCPYCEEQPACDEHIGYCSDECQDADFDNRVRDSIGEGY